MVNVDGGRSLRRSDLLDLVAEVDRIDKRQQKHMRELAEHRRQIFGLTLGIIILGLAALVEAAGLLFAAGVI